MLKKGMDLAFRLTGLTSGAEYRWANLRPMMKAAVGSRAAGCVVQGRCCCFVDDFGRSLEEQWWKLPLSNLGE